MHGLSFPGTNGGPSGTRGCKRSLGGVIFAFGTDGEITEAHSRYLWEDLEKALDQAGREAERRVAAGKRPQFCLMQQPGPYEEYCTKVWSAGEYGTNGPYYWEGIRVYPGEKIVAIEGDGDPLS